MPHIVGIEHVQLAMPAGGEGEARRFYREILGLEEVPKPANLAPRGGCWFEAPGVKLHLGVESDFRPARKAHPALLVAGLEALLVDLKAGGCPVEATEPLGDHARCYVADPFGNRIELIEA